MLIGRDGPAGWRALPAAQAARRPGHAATGATQPPKTRSSSSATAIATWSRSRPAATWMPSGSPLESSPSGTSVTGTPARLNTAAERQQPAAADRRPVARRHVWLGGMQQYPVADRVDQLGGDRSAGLDQPPLPESRSSAGSISVASVRRVWSTMRAAAHERPPRRHLRAGGRQQLERRLPRRPPGASRDTAAARAAMIGARHVARRRRRRRSAPTARSRASRSSRVHRQNRGVLDGRHPQSLQRDRRPDRRAQPRRLSGSSAIGPGHHPQQRHQVLAPARERPRLEHRRRRRPGVGGYSPEFGTSPGRRLVAEHAAEQCRDPDRARDVGGRPRTATRRSPPPRPRRPRNLRPPVASRTGCSCGRRRGCPTRSTVSAPRCW